MSNSWVYYSFFAVIALVGVFLYAYNPNRACIYSGGELLKRDRSVNLAVIIMIGYIVFWACIRNGVADTSEYIYNYEHLDINQSVFDVFKTKLLNEEKAPLFNAFALLCAKAGFSYTVYLSIIAIISGICLIYGIINFSDDVTLSCFLFVASMNFYWLFNGIRQFLVACIFFVCLRLIVEKKTVKFLIIAAILYLIHSSAIILIPIYFISNFKSWSLKIWICIISVMALVILFPNQINDWLDDSFVEYGYAEATKNDDGVNFFRVLVAAVTPTIAFLFRQNVESYKNKYIEVMVNMSLITVGLYAVGVVTSGVFIGRLPIYTELFNIIILPFLIKRVIPRSLKPIMWILCIGFFLLFFYLQTRNIYYTTFLFDSMNLKG